MPHDKPGDSFARPPPKVKMDDIQDKSKLTQTV